MNTDFYEGRVFRPPSEARSLIVQSTIGCSHNKCTFCDMYSEKRFRIRPVDDVKRDFERARKWYACVERVFLADGDAMMRKADEHAELLAFIGKLFPECERITCYASPKSVMVKTDAELLRIRENGLYMVYMGLESGSDTVLKSVNKGASAAEIIECAVRLRNAGIKVSATAISGLGGVGLTHEHAELTGAAFSAMKPDYIGILSLMVEPGTPLERQIREGTLVLPDAKGILEETRLMLEHTDAEGSVFRANHASNYIDLRGTLNADKTRLFMQIDYALSHSSAIKPEWYRGL